MDEATKALDNKLQEQIISNVRSMNCTVIFIAHRLKVARDADQIFVLIVAVWREEPMMSLSVMESFMLKCGRQCHETFNIHTTDLSFLGSFLFFCRIAGTIIAEQSVGSVALAIGCSRGC